MSRGFEIKKGKGYYYLRDRDGGLMASKKDWSYLIYDMDRWALLELWWTAFWAWLKG